ncbi:UdgX family uracil-DNA binding protein [Paracoccus laeviglucosivorans]|nr:UdgX family uracil-DNA binding protein [Paracoccus laeviglucosivorans]
MSAQADPLEWRKAARALAMAGIAPDAVRWSVGSDLFAADPVPMSERAPPRVPRAFPGLLETAICHSDPERFALLYQLLWRLQNQPKLLEIAPDPDVQRLHRMVKSVRRDSHKMHAFVRFREVPGQGPRRFIAWFEPDHHIIAHATPFFARRFADMDWLILTPKGSARFHAGQLHTDETPAEKPDLEDATEALWRTYFSSIFNPARLKVRAMQSEMPRKYWKNLPEAELIPGLIASAKDRVAQMAAAAPKAPPAFHAAIQSRRVMPEAPTGTWDMMRADAMACTRCDLHAQATQAVLGEGPEDAPLMIVGEQPGDHEDLTGRPFIGPAGQVLDRALAQAGLDRGRIYLTNAVKHFKFVPRGKRRIHQRPNTAEVSHCRWWLKQEIELVQPRLIVAMGASAVLGLTGQPVKMTDVRGHVVAGVPPILPTWHPSYLLRLPDATAAKAETANFTRDLALAAEFIASAGNPAGLR